METLAMLLADNPDEGLPFSTTVNEQRVLDAVLLARDDIDEAFKSRIRQWIRFNTALNMYEDEPYQTWVHAVYSQIEYALKKDDSGMPREMRSQEPPSQ